MYESITRFNKTLTKEQDQLFVKVLANLQCYIKGVSEDSFKKGYCVGARMASEVLIDSEKYQKKDI